MNDRPGMSNRQSERFEPVAAPGDVRKGCGDE
jgi:hypothetical protein